MHVAFGILLLVIGLTANFPPNSVGIVATQLYHCQTPLALACGRFLPNFTLAYETYGELNADKSNAILICHALSGHQHVAGYHHAEETKPGWWDLCVGPG